MKAVLDKAFGIREVGPVVSTLSEQEREELSQRICGVTTPPPGRGPYDNQRPIYVPAKFSKLSVEEFLLQRFSYVDPERWRSALSASQILWEGRRPVRSSDRVEGGTTLIHLLPGTREPEVNCSIRVVFADRDLLVLTKPAPLPMHPCGRFHRNTLSYILKLALPDWSLRIVHRLDADTSGLVVLARSAAVAKSLV